MRELDEVSQSRKGRKDSRVGGYRERAVEENPMVGFVQRDGGEA
jgi:hypothetical protein